MDTYINNIYIALQPQFNYQMHFDGTIRYNKGTRAAQLDK